MHPRGAAARTGCGTCWCVAWPAMPRHTTISCRISHRHLRAFFRRRLPSLPDEVEDLVQETLLAVHNQRHTYDPGPAAHGVGARDRASTSWWTFCAGARVANCVTIRWTTLADVLAHTDSEVAARAPIDLAKLLQQLPDRQRLPIVHMKLEGLSVVETARVTGMSESAVKVGVHRGLKALAAMIRALR